MSLPVPEAAALAVSTQLAESIVQQIGEHGGWIDFAHYMSMALYAPGLGYYSAGAAKFGAQGDFVTAPEISPLFGQTLARQVAQVLHATRGDVLEAGAGSGALACQLLSELDALDALPAHYFILELSADLRERQRQRVQACVPALFDRVVWLDTLPDTIRGCVVANELLDAMPVHVLHWRDDEVFERGVTWHDGQFAWQERPVPAGMLRDQALVLALAAPYLSEINLAAQAWVSTLAERMACGALLLIDYGFGEREYYHPQRDRGSLVCHYRQHVHDDPFFLPGLQDITAHVDFTAIAAAGLQAGMKLAGFTTQAQFLLNCGITALLEQASPEQPAVYLPQVAAVQKLLSPAEMGELFKVMALTRALAEPLVGFVQGDQRRRL